MKNTKVVKIKCPFCEGTMTPIYNGDRNNKVIHSWECSRERCQFNENYFGGCTIEHRNMKKIFKMQKRIQELESLLKAQEE